MRRMYSEKQIQKIVQEADWSNVNLGVKTLEQQEANWEANDIFDNITVPTGITYTKKYARFEAINGVLYIVHCFSLENTTESSISVNISHTISLEEEIAKQIFDFDGKSANEQNLSNIMSESAYYGSTTELYNEKVFTLRNTTVENQIQYLSVSALVVGANSTMNLSYRGFLTLL